MTVTQGLFEPATPGQSNYQRELETRKRCYQEKILRGIYATHRGYNSGWTAQDQARYGGVGENQGPSTCDNLLYKKPEQPSCATIGRYPVTWPSSGEPLFIALARLEAAARQPERQRELFGWVTPVKDDLVGQTAFEIAKARYWEGPAVPVPTSVGESLQHLHGLEETADFHANYLLRLLYLYGDTPPHLRTHRAGWRRIDRFDRDINFSRQIEARIGSDLLAFKYWIDEPFFADDSGGENLRKWRWNQATQAADRAGKKKTDKDYPKEEDYQSEMTFWSENHQILFATAEYLAGQFWPEAIFRVGNHFRKEGPNKTRSTDLLGRQHMDKAKPRILRWLRDRLRFGFSEWNSAGYYDEDFTAIFNLADFCLDDEIQTRACMVLDLMVFDLARFTHRGSFGVTAGRCYFEHKNCGYDQSVGDLIEVLFGTRGGVIVERSATSAGAIASAKRYTVPDVLMAIGQDHPKEMIDRSRVSINFEEAERYNVGFESDADVMFWWSRAAFFTKWVIPATRKRVDQYHLGKTSPFKDIFSKLDVVAEIATVAPATALPQTKPAFEAAARSKLADEASVLTEGSALTRANLYTYRSAHAMLSSVQNFHSGQMNFQTQFCQATLSLGASVWTTYPSAGDPLGISGTHDGPNWWTGSAVAPRVIQHRNAAIVAYKPKDLQFLIFGHRTHAWFPKPAFDSGSVVQRRGNCNADSGMWTFGKVGDGYVALFSAQAPQWTADGPWMDRELVADGARNFFIFQVGGVDDFGSYEDFIDQVCQARIHTGGVGLVTPGEVAGAAGGAALGAAGGFAVAGPVGALAGGIGGAIFGAEHSSEDFECSYDIPGGDRLELHYDNNQVRYAGWILSDDNYPRFENPYVKCGRVSWDQYCYTIKHVNHSLTHDFRTIQDVGTPITVSRRLDGSESHEYDCSTGPRPFYVVGHNPNTIAAVNAALDAGANAIEPDVNVYDDRQNDLCISEAGVLDADEGGDSDAPSLAQFLDELHGIARKRPELALVVFDCKPKVATPVLGATLLREIRNRLTFDTKLNVIISVSQQSESAIFDDIKKILGPREGLMIDEDNDPSAVASFFIDAGVENRCYGNGNKFQDALTSPNLRPSIELACGLRAGQNSFKFIYEWTNNDDERMREFIRTGVDGIITDEVTLLRNITEEDEFQPLIRLASRDDNPFTPPNANYELAVHTGDVHMGGTDANVTFTVTGAKGTIRKVIDTNLDGRMERNDWNFVTIQSPDIGELISITVQRDNQGNAPDWYVDRILIKSFRFGVSKQAVFNRWIDTTSPYTKKLAPAL